MGFFDFASKIASFHRGNSKKSSREKVRFFPQKTQLFFSKKNRFVFCTRWLLSFKNLKIRLLNTMFIDFASKTAFSNCKNSKKSSRKKLRFFAKKTQLFFDCKNGYPWGTPRIATFTCRLFLMGFFVFASKIASFHRGNSKKSSREKVRFFAEKNAFFIFAKTRFVFCTKWILSFQNR